MQEIEPLSLNDFSERYGDKIEYVELLGQFSAYCAGYWVQQNPEKEGDDVYKKMKGAYENSSIRSLLG